MTIPTYKPVRDGAHAHNGTVVAVDKNNIGIAKHAPKLKMYIGTLPDNWRLCEAVVDDAALAVPIDDIERALRAAEPVLGIHREGRLLLRRVQRWLDTLPRQSEA
jgi:hypothetical protein